MIEWIKRPRQIKAFLMGCIVMASINLIIIRAHPADALPQETVSCDVVNQETIAEYEYKLEGG